MAFLLKNINKISIALFFVACLIPWVVFYFASFEGYGFKGFHLPQEIHVIDWHKELEYLRILRESLLSNELPFFVQNLNELFGVSSITDKGEFLGIPIYPFSFQSILLMFMEPMQFHVFNHFLFIILGFFGCYLIKKEFSLSLLSFFFIVMTFNFYGGFVGKIAAYGPSQLGYYLSPYIILVLYRVGNIDKSSYKNQSVFLAICLGVALSMILFQGSLHYFAEWITFLIFWGIFNLKHFKFLLIAALSTILLSMVRLLPAAIINSTTGNTHIVQGYGFNPEFFLQTFISIRGLIDFPAFAWWEFSNYISIIGFLLISIFGCLVYFINKQQSLNIKGFIPPLLLLFFISFSDFQTILIPDFIPILNIESMTTRYFFIIILFLTIIAAVNFDKFYKGIDTLKSKLMIWFLMIVHSLFLYLNSFEWPLHKIQAQLYDYGGTELSGSLRLKNINLYMQNDLTHTSYVNSFYVGLCLTGLTVFILVFYFYFYFKNLDKKSSL